MNKSLRIIALFAILPLFTAGMTTGYFSDAEALKGSGVGTSKYGSGTMSVDYNFVLKFQAVNLLGWGPDGRTIYYIVTDATPSGPAGMMGVVSSPTSANLIANSAAVELYQFKNGLTGTGPLGF